MKGIFIAYDQAYNMDIADAIQKIGVRGFTMWQDIAGRGSETGEPHLGNHAWPTMNNAMLTFVPDELVDQIMDQIVLLHHVHTEVILTHILRINIIIITAVPVSLGLLYPGFHIFPGIA